MTRNFFQFVCAAGGIALCSPVMFSQTPPPQPPALTLQAMLGAHHAWTTAPASVRITGTLTRGKATEPVKITATAQEEALVESAAGKLELTAQVTGDVPAGTVFIPAGYNDAPVNTLLTEDAEIVEPAAVGGGTRGLTSGVRRPAPNVTGPVRADSRRGADG